MKTICICGGGSLGHVIAGYLSSQANMVVNILTEHVSLWNNQIDIFTPDNIVLKGRINNISSHPSQVISEADIVLLCVPGFLIENELIKIKDYIKKDAFVGGVFSSTGFFFAAQQILPKSTPLWGFQRVPFIARVKEYGKSAFLLGYKDNYSIAVENVPQKQKIEFASFIEETFGKPTFLLNNYLEASLSNSNPLLHTARLYSMFHSWHSGVLYQENPLFYEEWTDEASELLINMDYELFKVLSVLPVSPNFLSPILKYYGCTDAKSLTNKIKSIESFKRIPSPMIKEEQGWVPDFSSRYFIEDFSFGLRFIWQLAHEYSISVPVIDEVYNWGINKIEIKYGN